MTATRGRDDPLTEAEFVSLTRQYGGLVYSIAGKYARSPVDQEDLYQDIWLRVMEVLPRKNPETPMRGWLFMVAANVGKEWTRRRYRIRDFLVKASGMLRVDAVTPDPIRGVDPGVEERIWEAVQALPDLQRRVVLLRVTQDLSTAETAEVIGRAEGTVKASLHRAIKTLKDKLGDLAQGWDENDL